MLSTKYCILIFFLCVFSAFAKDRIRLTDVQVITLHKDKWTTGRRSQPVPQLKCVGGTAGCSAVQPKVVQCYNKGFDGTDVQWECKADMDSAYTFGEITVVCEGYDYPEDPYVLGGSCGLEYTIDYTSGHQGSQSQSHFQNHYSKPKKNSFVADLVFYAIIAAFAYTIYRVFVNMSDPNRNSRGGAGSGGSDGYGGGPPPGGGGPPPPGFRPDYYSGDDSCNSNTYSSYRSGYSQAAGAGNRPGFWTGLGAGGLLGYMLGNRGGNTGYYNNRAWGAGPSTSAFGHTFGGGGGGGNGGSRSASGFGGTRRR